jgi:hypothetical protein
MTDERYIVRSRQTSQFRRQHVREAFDEVGRARTELRKDRYEEASEAEPSLSGRRSTGMHKPFAFRPGARLGTFELVDVVGQTRSGQRLWRVRCDCGREHVRNGSMLASRARAGLEPTCPRCSTERWRSFKEFRQDVYKDAWRRQWVDYGTLWTGGQTLRLMEGVREDLEDEFGSLPEPAPSVRNGYLEGVEEGWWQDREDYVAAYGSGRIFEDPPRKMVLHIDNSRISDAEFSAAFARARAARRGRSVSKEVEQALARAKAKELRALIALGTKTDEETRKPYRRSAQDQATLEKSWQERLEYEARVREQVEREAEARRARAVEASAVQVDADARWDAEWEADESPHYLARCGHCRLRLRFASPKISLGDTIYCWTCRAANVVTVVSGIRVALSWAGWRNNNNL